ncbi:MAG: glutathione peroxidase [Verrucomicrobiales bacterium]|nr:glutathione peroxidase [Verrucomicrobiales bacterium]|tara:strand:+ start:795 stop:1322 length:528 start_codon:yes stop_codon:yes gene_type:complete
MKSLCVFAIVCVMSMTAQAADLNKIPLKDIKGKDTSLAALKGKAVLIVNVASRCGYTDQYSGLERLYRQMKKEGLVILGVPCNDFGRQEPDSEAKILQFCKSNYSVTFPMTSKVRIKPGKGQHPLYAALTKKSGPVGWNFEKFLVAKNGKLVGHFGSHVEPNSSELTDAIKKALK